MIIIPGFTTSSKTPGAVGQQVFGAGANSIGAAAVKCLLIGNADSTGTATPDVSVLQCFSEDDCATFAGPRSELANMGYAALKVPGVVLWLAAMLEAAGGTAATLTITIAGSYTVGGTLYFDLGGKVFPVNIAAGDSVTVVAAAIATALGSDAHLYCTGLGVAGVCTLTVDSKGLRGNQHIVHVDKSQMPAGMTCVLAGGTPLADGGVPFSGGAGQDSTTNILAVLLAGTWDYQGWASNDSTSVRAVADQINVKAGPLEGRLENAIFASNGTQAAAQTLAQTTLDEQLCEWNWMAFHRAHPSRVTSCWTAIRSTTEGTNPNPNYCGTVLPGIPGHFRDADIPKRSVTDACLNNSLSPLTTKNGKCVMVRAITTHSLNGAAADYRTLDIGQAVVPQYTRKLLVNFWNDTYSVANPYVRNDPPPESPVPLDGFATPRLWNAEVEAQLRKLERAGFIVDVDNNLPQTQYDPDAKRLMTVAPVSVAPINAQQGIQVRQVG